MKEYKYLVSTNLSRKQVMADRAEVTANGELVFTVGIFDTIGYAVVAAAAPGYWLRFWEVVSNAEERGGDDEQQEIA